MKGKPARSWRIAVALAAVAAALLLTAPSAGAQTNGTIAGTVDAPGPLAPFSICVSAVDLSTFATAATATADGGNYAISVPAGTYAVLFVPCGRAGFGPAVSLYRNASSYDTATPVTVTEGATTTLLHQSSAPAGRVSGVVTDADGRGVTACFVVVFTRTPTPTLVGVVGTDGFGRYVVNNLPAGQMDVLAACGNGFLNTFNGDTTEPSAAVPVTITPGTTSGADITAARVPGSVAGRVTVASGFAAGGACASAYSPAEQLLGSSELRPDGSWAITGLPAGDVRVRFHGCAPPFLGGYFPEWYDDVADLADATPVPVAADSATTRIDAVLTQHAGLGFNLRNPGGDPVSGVCVWITNTAATELVTVKYAATQTPEVGGLRPGDYSVGFTDCGSNGFAPEWYQDAPDHAGSTPLTAIEGTTQYATVILG